MNIENLFLISGGAASFFIFFLHILLTFNPVLYIYFGADELAKLHKDGSRMPRVASILLALMFLVWGTYAFSGAGILSPMPWMKTVLLIIGAIYVLRGLMLPSELIKTFKDIKQAKFIVFSAFSLTAGVMYILGWNTM